MMISVVVKKFRIFRASWTRNTYFLAATSKFAFPDSSFPTMVEAEEALSERSEELVGDVDSFVVLPFYFGMELDEEEVSKNKDAFLLPSNLRLRERG